MGAFRWSIFAQTFPPASQFFTGGGVCRGRAAPPARFTAHRPPNVNRRGGSWGGGGSPPQLAPPNFRRNFRGHSDVHQVFRNAISILQTDFTPKFKQFFRFWALRRSPAPKIKKNAKFSLSIFFDFWRLVRSTPPTIGKFAKFYGQNSAEFQNSTKNSKRRSL